MQGKGDESEIRLRNQDGTTSWESTEANANESKPQLVT